VAVGEGGGVAEFISGVGCPATNLGEFGREGVSGGEDVAFEFALGDECSGLGLTGRASATSTVERARPETGSGMERPRPMTDSRPSAFSRE